MNIMSLKKVAAIGALSSTVVLSGCSIPFMGEEPAVSESAAKTEVTTNPEKLYFDFAKASGKVGLETIGLDDLDKGYLVKSASTVSIAGDFNMEGTPMGGGTGTFEMIGNVKADYSDVQNPLLSDDISVKVDALGGLFKLDTSAELRIVEKSFFTQFSKFDASFPGLTPEISAIVQKFVGQWYGNSFEEINAYVETNFGITGFDIQKVLTGSINPMLDAVTLIQDIGNNPQDYITFGKFVEEKDEYYFFEVTPKKETYEKFANIAIELVANAGVGTEADEEITNFINSLVEDLSLQSVVIGYTPEHPEYFKISKIIDEGGTIVFAENTEKGLTISMKKIEGDDAGEIVFTKTSEGKVSFIVDISTAYNGERTELLSGTCTDTKHEFTIILPVYDYELGEDVLKEVLKGSFNKKGDTWAGELTSPEFKEGKLVISDAKGGMYTAHAKVSALYNENTLVNIVFDVKSETPETITVEKPENAKSFETIQTDVEKEMNALYGISEDDTAVQIDDENIEVNTEDAEVMIDAGSLEVSTEDAEVMIDAGSLEVNTEDAEVVIDADAQGGADYSTIIPQLARMAELMNENPTDEAQAEFLALKAEVDAYAAENDVAPETLKELLLNEIVKQK